MAAILGVLNNIWLLITLLPKILALIDSLKQGAEAIQDQRRVREEQKRQEEMKKTADKLKEAIDAGDKKATDDALDSIVNDYNRRG